MLVLTLIASQIYSGIFTAVNHPRILRALYIDGDAYKYVLTIL
jgi:hypothetical protein